MYNEEYVTITIRTKYLLQILSYDCTNSYNLIPDIACESTVLKIVDFTIVFWLNLGCENSNLPMAKSVCQIFKTYASSHITETSLPLQMEPTKTICYLRCFSS